MNSGQFIKSHLTGCVKNNHTLSIELSSKVIDKVLDDFQKNHFNDLDELIKNASDKIKKETGLIGELSKEGGTTAREFAEAMHVCVATARKILNSSLIASKCCDKKPYTYALTDE